MARHAIPEGMQFQSNSDYPPAPPGYPDPESAARDPSPFLPAQIDPCARITTRVYVPRRDQVVTVKDVLVRTMPAPHAARAGGGGGGRAGGGGAAGGGGGGGGDWTDDDDNDDDSWDDSDTESDASMGDAAAPASAPSSPPAAASAQPSAGASPPRGPPTRAYWIQRTLREAIYGRVKYAVVLRRRDFRGVAASAAAAEWEVTDEKCAVKEMSWNHIRRERDRLAEDPIKEVSAMQYLRKFHERLRLESAGGAALAAPFADGGAHATAGGVGGGGETMLDTHIMMPLDLLSDDRYLYSVMPFCNGGELFDRLDERQRFTEEECRYWMHQILDGLENLQRAGVCHRDMSLENLLVHDDRICLIIDMGMCLLIPSEEEGGAGDGALKADEMMMESFAGMSVGAGGVGNGGALARRRRLDHRNRRRYLIRPQGTCGKWHYMSPEIALNRAPFDGHAVDVWASGVILFLMLTGFPPWERPCQSDERFRYMTAGYLVQMLTEWELGLSPDAMDLLQRMLWLDPKDRLGLEQVRAHPWMLNGGRALS